MKRKLTIEIEGDDGQGHVDVKWTLTPNFNPDEDIPKSGFVKFTTPLMAYLRTGMMQVGNTMFIGHDMPREEINT